MPSSLRRKDLRLFLGANRKLRTFRWIGRQTVGVCQLFGAPCITEVVCAKAEEGAERSFLGRRRKRVRGQRRGVLRSRGDKPRSNSTPTARLPKGVRARFVNHSGRKFIWSERKRSQIVKSKSFLLIAKSCRAYRLDDSRDRDHFVEDHSGDPLWNGWTRHLRALRAHARKAGIVDGANPFSRSALDFIATNTSQGGEVGFLDILEGLRFGKRPGEHRDYERDALEDERSPSPVEELPSSSKGRESKPVTARPRKKTRGTRQRRLLTNEDGQPLSSAEAARERNKFADLFSGL
jgi:hypothetical protein